MLACTGGRDNRVLVQCIRRGDVDDVDLGIADELFVIAIRALGADPGGDLTGLDRIASCARHEARAGRSDNPGRQVVYDDMTESNDTPPYDAARVQDATSVLLVVKKAGTAPGFPCCNLSA